VESGWLLRRRAHHRAAHVHILLQCIDVRAHHQPDGGANDDHHSPNSGTHVNNLTCAYAGTDGGHYGTSAGTHVDVQL